MGRDGLGWDARELNLQRPQTGYLSSPVTQARGDDIPSGVPPEWSLKGDLRADLYALRVGRRGSSPSVPKPASVTAGHPSEGPGSPL